MTVTVQPQVSIVLDTAQVSAHTRVGQTAPTVTVGITENFGTEYFSVNAATDSSWMSASATQSSQGHAQLSVYFRPQQAGTYDGTVTVSIGSLQSGKQTVNVHYVVDPAATIQLSTTTPALRVVKGQPVQPVTVDVTGSVPGVSFSMFVGQSYTWLQYKTIGTTTPGQLQFTVDANAAASGYYSFNFFVSGENNQRIDGTIYVDISDGTPLSVAPPAVNYTFYRGGQYINQASIVTFTAPSPTPVNWSIPDTFVLQPRTGSLATLNGIVFVHTSTSSSVPHHARYSCSRIDDGLEPLCKLTRYLRDLTPADYFDKRKFREILATSCIQTNRNARVRNRAGRVAGRRLRLGVPGRLC